MKNGFNIQAFQNMTGKGWLGSEFLFLDSTQSTNTYLKKLDPEKISHGMLLITDHQTGGRGQYQKKWESAPRQNLTFSLLFTPPNADGLMLLTVAAATVVARIFNRISGKPATVKWPNDIMLDGKKAGGVLTECLFMGSKPERVLVGIGLNINQTEFPPAIAEKATSLKCVTGVNISRENILAEFINVFEHIYTRWHKQDPELGKEISRQIEGYGEWVQVHLNGDSINGRYKFLGINEKGECLLLNEELDVNTFSHEQIRIIADSKRVSETV